MLCTTLPVEMMTLLREAFLQIDADMGDRIEWEEFMEYCIANASTSVQKEASYQSPDISVSVVQARATLLINLVVWNNTNKYILYAYLHLCTYVCACASGFACVCMLRSVHVCMHVYEWARNRVRMRICV